MGRAVVASGNNRSDSPFAPLEVHPSFVPVLLRFRFFGRSVRVFHPSGAGVHRDSALRSALRRALQLTGRLAGPHGASER